ncbi:AEC family transporter [Acidobacteriota bacterium]
MAASVVPVFLMIGLGVLLSRKLLIHVQTLTILTLYVFSPCLIFDAIVRHTSRISFLPLALCTVLITLFCLGTGRLTATVFRIGRAPAASLTGLSAFVNAGNMGLPIALFAYGEPGLARAAAFMVVMAVMINTIGVLVFSMGREVNLRKGLLQVFKVPLIYAAALAMLLPSVGVTLPSILGRPIMMLGQAAIPVLLLAYGIQLGSMELKLPRFGTFKAVAIRLVLAPAVAFMMAYGLRSYGLFEPLDAKVFILMSGLPPAVYNYLLAERFGGDLEMVSEGILWATIISFFSVSLILGLLG